MKRFGIAVIIAALGVPTLLQLTEKVERKDQQVFKVYVVGGKIGGNCRDGKRDKIPASSEDVWRGALWACEEDPERLCTTPESEDLHETEWSNLRLNSARPKALFQLIPDNDCRDPEDAAKLAMKLQKDPAVLAVIGHSTSRTTGRVAEIYAQAGIPLIMPEATAASAATYYSRRTRSPDTPQDHIPNYIRLQPSDDQAQAPAIAHTILQLLQDKSRVYLLTGMEGNAGEYSKGLVQGVKRLLPRKVQPVEHSEERDQNSSMAEMISGANPIDIVFFAGYRDQAQEILRILNRKLEGRAAVQRPVILLPESCNGFEIEEEWKTFRIYRTGPADTTACFGELQNDEGLRKWRRENEPDKLPISMLYGHDSVRLLSRAIAQCRERFQTITRGCVLEQLRATIASGACGGYSFREGENLLSSYYVFSSKAATPLIPRAVAGSYEIAPVQIIRTQDVGAGK